MSKKIAVLVNEDTMQRCSCGGCLKAYMNKVDSFERYADLKMVRWLLSLLVNLSKTAFILRDNERFKYE